MGALCSTVSSDSDYSVVSSDSDYIVSSTLYPNLDDSKLNFLIVGLDAAGKSTILNKLKLNEKLTTIPIIGFPLEILNLKSTTFTVLYAQSQGQVHSRHVHFYKCKQGIIFVVDSNDRERMHLARKELSIFLNMDVLRDAVLLVLANKQDLPEAMSADEIVKELGLTEITNRTWHIQPCCAKTGQGLHEGITWLKTTKCCKPKTKQSFS